MSHILLSQQRLAGRSIVSTGLALLLLLMSGCTSMQQAAKTGDVQTIIKGLSAGKDVDMVDSTGRPLLAIAAERGQLEIIRELISRGADLEKKDSRGMTPLYIAAGYNQLAAVQEMQVLLFRNSRLPGQAHITQDRVQRRPDLVTHVRQERAFGMVSPAGYLQSFLQIPVALMLLRFS